MKKTNGVLFVLILCISLLAAPLHMLAQEQDPVAKVNGVEITRADFLAFLEEEFGPYIIQELIQRELVNQRAAELQVEIDDEEFAQMYSLIIQQLGGPEALQMFLMQNNATEAQFIEQLQWNMLLSSLAAAEVEVTEDAVAEWFEQNRSFYDQAETVEVSHILVDEEEEAQELLALLEDGEDFETLAIEKSLDPGTSNSGGYLGNVQKGQTVEEFEEMAFSLAIGEYGLANSNFGWHIILVHAKSEAKTADLNEIYEAVERDFRSDTALDARSYMQKLETDADIEVLWQAK